MNSNPKSEYGYILIDTPEKRAANAPMRKWDEVFCSHQGFVPVMFPSGSFLQDLIYRRPIDPGEGWELVPWKECPKPECEFTRDGFTWREYGGLVESVEQYYAIHQNRPTHIVAFRRRKQPTAQPIESGDGWVDARTASPPCGQRLWYVPKTMPGKVLLCEELTSTGTNIDFWRPVKPGEIPEPPKSREELAFEAWHKANNGASLRKGWLAAIQWQKDQTK